MVVRSFITGLLHLQELEQVKQHDGGQHEGGGESQLQVKVHLKLDGPVGRGVGGLGLRVGVQGLLQGGHKHGEVFGVLGS